MEFISDLVAMKNGKCSEIEESRLLLQLISTQLRNSLSILLGIPLSILEDLPLISSPGKRLASNVEFINYFFKLKIKKPLVEQIGEANSHKYRRKSFSHFFVHYIIKKNNRSSC